MTSNALWWFERLITRKMHGFERFASYVGLIALGCGGSGAAAKAVPGGGAGGTEVAGGGNESSSAGQSAGGRSSSVGAGGTANRTCKNPDFKCRTSGAMPAGAPSLSTTMWTNISPAGPPYPDAFGLGLAIDPCDPGTMYLCVDGFDLEKDKPGLYKTVDGGSNWEVVGNLDEPLNLRIDPQNPQHIYVADGVRGATTGFQVSCDGGKTFYIPDAFLKLNETEGIYQYDTYDVAVDPTDFYHVLLTFHAAWGWTDTKWNASSGVLESKDGGESWIVHPPLDGWGYGHSINFLYKPEMNIGNANSWLIGTQGPGMFRTTDAGQTWKKVSDLGIQHGGGTIYYDNQGILWAAGAAANLRSIDNGETWTQVAPAKGYNALIGDGKVIYTAPGFGPTPILTTPEGSDGSTWTPFNGQMFASGPYEMAVDKKNGILYSSSWGAGLWALKIENIDPSR